MTNLALIWKEICYRKLNFVLSCVGVATAVTLFLAGAALLDSYRVETEHRLAAEEQTMQQQLKEIDDKTRKLMLTMGFNLMIVHQDTNMSDFWSADYSAVDMPVEYVERLAHAPELTLVTHLVATLQQKIRWEGHSVLLVGYLPETPQSHAKKQKKPMGYDIEPGTVYVGFELAGDRKADDMLEINGESFRIASILPEKGSKQDVTFAVHLSDAQRLLDKPGRVNQIMAIGCRCAGERLPKIRAQLAEVLPETRITEFNSIAVARAEQRDMIAESNVVMLAEKKQEREQHQQLMDRGAAIAMPMVAIACAIWVGFLALANVRERRTEIGLLRALGKGAATLFTLFLGKAVVLGLLGGAIGLVAAELLAGQLAVMSEIAPENFRLETYRYAWALLGAPLLCAMAAYLPTLLVVQQDPASSLRDA